MSHWLILNALSKHGDSLRTPDIPREQEVQPHPTAPDLIRPLEPSIFTCAPPTRAMDAGMFRWWPFQAAGWAVNTGRRRTKNKTKTKQAERGEVWRGTRLSSQVIHQQTGQLWTERRLAAGENGQLLWVEPSHSTPDGIKSSVLPLVPRPQTHVIPKLFHLLNQRVLKQTFHFGSLGDRHCGIIQRLAAFAQCHKPWLIGVFRAEWWQWMRRLR